MRANKRIVNRFLIAWTVAVFFGTFITETTLFADTIYLKSGAKIEGDIMAHSDKSIMLKVKSGEYKTYPSEEIERIEENTSVETTAAEAKGRIQKKSETIDRPKYLVYIPAGVDHSKKYPLVIALSPGGDAQSMINTWRSVSDKNKWIIFASKEFQNNVDMDKIMSSLLSIVSRDLLLRLPVDRSKIIATGFSGGAMGSHAFAFLYPRLASAVVLNTGMMHEHYAQKKYNYPRGKLAVFLASPTDFRYEAMKKDRKFLEDLGWKTEWIEFKGGHTIAPASCYQEAAQWLQKNFK